MFVFKTCIKRTHINNTCILINNFNKKPMCKLVEIQRSPHTKPYVRFPMHVNSQTSSQTEHLKTNAIFPLLTPPIEV